MDTEEFITTLNSILGIDLWPSVMATFKDWRHSESKATKNLFFRQILECVDIEPQDIWRSVSKFKQTLTLTQSKSQGLSLRDITTSGEWYLIDNLENTGYMIGYWGEGERRGLDTKDDERFGNSFDLNLVSRGWEEVGKAVREDGPIFLNINHSKPWIDLGQGDIYIFEPSSMEPEFMNWLNVNPLEVK